MRTNLPKRRGAALLIVIGLISLLLISTMAFSVLMNIERNAAANYRHSVQARQLLYAGLAQAISDIDQNVADDAYPRWTTSTRTNQLNGQNHVFTTTNDILQSIDIYTHNLTTSAICTAKVLSAAAMQYIPKTMYQAVQTVTPEYMAFAVNNGGSFPNGSNTVGRYAYIAINASGLLDANVVGASNRWLGTSASEIQAAPSVLFDVQDAIKFKIDHTAAGRYDTLADMANGNQGGIYSDKLSNFETFSYAPDTDLAPDGHPKMYIGGNFMDNTPGHFYYPGEAATPYQRLVTVLSYPDMLGYYDVHSNDFLHGLGVDEIAYRVNSFISCMQDYTSSNTVPSNLSAPKIKNEFCISIVQWDPNLQWFPSPVNKFVYTQNIVVRAYNFSGFHGGTYTANVSINLTGKPTISTPQNVPVNYSVQLNALLNAKLYSTNITINSYMQTASGEITFTNTIVTSFSPPAPPTANFTFANPLNAYVMVNLSNSVQTVDQVPANWGSSTNAFTFADALSLPASPGTWNYTIHCISPALGANNWWYESLDPRMNWSADSRYSLWYMNGNGAHSQGAACGIPNGNQAMSSLNLAGWVFANPSSWYTYSSGQLEGVMFDGMGRIGGQYWHDDFNSQITFLCPNRPFISVGELAYIPINPWQTPRVFDHGDDPAILGMAANLNLPTWTNYGCAVHYSRLFDYFTMTPPPASASAVVPKRGLVNINTRSTNVLAAAFYNMPINDYVAGPRVLTAGQAQFLAGTLSSFIQTNQYLSGCATNASVLGMIPWTSPAITNALGLNNEMDRKAVMRNAMALFTARQQIYTIIVRADAMSSDYGGVVQGSGVDSVNALNNGTVLGSSSAVFQIWRDPVKDANGNHPCFVRLCKILSL